MLPTLDVLILAAGASNRMGDQIKQLLPLGNSTFIEQTIYKARSLNARNVHVVLGAYFEQINSTMNHLPIQIHQCPDWEEGMGTSLAFGVKKVADSEHSPDGLLILLIDQPLLIAPESNYLAQLINKWYTSGIAHPLVATRYENSLGVPAIFPSIMFSELMKLKGDSGAKHILNAVENKPMTISSPIEEIKDVDTPEDYNRLL